MDSLLVRVGKLGLGNVSRRPDLQTHFECAASLTTLLGWCFMWLENMAPIRQLNHRTFSTSLCVTGYYWHEYSVQNHIILTHIFERVWLFV